jgi:very-short-patch-repair endonuclease
VRKPQPVELVRKLRRNQTEAEGKLWVYIKNRQICGVKFRRQRAIGKYVVDFVSLENKLIIEIDGGQHNEFPNIIKDEERTKYLESQGYQVLRFWNNDVLENIDGVLDNLIEILNTGKHPHLTSP